MIRSYDEGFDAGIRFAIRVIRECANANIHANYHTRRIVNTAYTELAYAMEIAQCQHLTNTKVINTPNS